MRPALSCLLGLVLLLTACTTTVPGTAVPTADPATGRDLIVGYFRDLNDSGDRGAAAQMEFLRRTQHPDFTNMLCDLDGLTVRVRPILSTLRPDSRWAPEAGSRPRGDVYVVAVSMSVRQDDQTVGEQIGSDRVVVLDGAVYGFMPCPQ